MPEIPNLGGGSGPPIPSLDLRSAFRLYASLRVVPSFRAGARMAGKSESSDVTSDTETLYQLGLAQEITLSAPRLLRSRFSIVASAFVLRCLASYGEAAEHPGPFVVHI
jgi:hypothetical protein